MMISAVIMTAITVMMLTMMIAMSIRIIFQRSGSQRLCCHVCRALNTGIEPDPGIRQSHLSTHSNTAAN